MKIEHLAIWVKDLEKMKEFYVKYFNMNCSNKYENTKKGFTSYFLSFPNETTRIEIMNMHSIKDSGFSYEKVFGFTHFAISVGGKQRVNELTKQFREDGYVIYSEPRTTGDGYYESVVLDCEGNHVEITE